MDRLAEYLDAFLGYFLERCTGDVHVNPRVASPSWPFRPRPAMLACVVADSGW